MTTAYGIAEAKARLSHLIDQVARGEEVTITRHGKPVVRLLPIVNRTAWLEDIKKLRESQPKSSDTAADLIRQLRDESY